MIDHIPTDKHEGVLHDIQWVIRNMYKDLGFIRSKEKVQQCRDTALGEIEEIVANAEVTICGRQSNKKS